MSSLEFRNESVYIKNRKFKISLSHKAFYHGCKLSNEAFTNELFECV